MFSAAASTVPCGARAGGAAVGARIVLRQALYHAVRAQVEQLSERAQAVIQRYAGAAGALAGAHAGMCAVTGMLPWAHPTSQEYEELARVPPCCCLLLACGVHGRPLCRLRSHAQTGRKQVRSPQLVWAQTTHGTPLQLTREIRPTTTAFCDERLLIVYMPAFLNSGTGALQPCARNCRRASMRHGCWSTALRSTT